MVYDDSGDEPKVIAYKDKGAQAVVEDDDTWNAILEIAHESR